MYYKYETLRLYLQILDSSHAAKVLDFYTRNSAEFETLEPRRSEKFYTEQYQKTMLEVEYNYALSGKQYRFWIFEKEDPDTIIGTISIRNILGHPFSRCELGYKIDGECRNRGYGTEAVIAACGIAFNDLNLHRVEATCLPDNEASVRVLTKAGFENEGYLKKYIEINGVYRDHLLYARTTVE